MKAGAPCLQSAHLFELVRERIRYVHYSLNIVKCYLFGVNYFCIRQPTG